MPSEAKAPFNNAKADIILCSSDNVYFRVFRCMLAFASPFFEAMFDLPQPRRNHFNDQMFGDLDIIQVSENSKTLDMLLRFCYPAAVKGPGLEDINDVEQVLEAAMKYGMEDVEERVRKAMVAPSLLESNPVRILAVACRFGLRTEASIAARYSLLHTAPTHDSLAAEHLPSDVIQGLVAYRSRCGQAARTLCDNLDWLKRSQTYSFYEWWTNCCPCDSKADVRYLAHGTYPREWWADYMDRTAVALEESPCGATLMRNLAEAVERAKSCPSCRRCAQDQMVQFTKTFAQELERVIAEITLDIVI
ncbi:uncharacterized protein EDB93DRAFT_760088 [Suillus bovinus]|uniref:uncharacterized protein n=1 Tax=Suillus bovinus TaxID=48563 RepID=UPI001B880B7A|nr:uncharacterized protein EDB93DRAFT_760088 [Suillus bovinus]KAG2137605.1 hypothetical protein EDB93DRAFT_760088 [Suillus bovinus]